MDDFYTSQLVLSYLKLGYLLNFCYHCSYSLLHNTLHIRPT